MLTQDVLLAARRTRGVRSNRIMYHVLSCSCFGSAILLVFFSREAKSKPNKYYYTCFFLQTHDWNYTSYNICFLNAIFIPLPLSAKSHSGTVKHPNDFKNKGFWSILALCLRSVLVPSRWCIISVPKNFLRIRVMMGMESLIRSCLRA